MTSIMLRTVVERRATTAPHLAGSASAVITNFGAENGSRSLTVMSARCRPIDSVSTDECMDSTTFWAEVRRGRQSRKRLQRLATAQGQTVRREFLPSQLTAIGPHGEWLPCSQDLYSAVRVASSTVLVDALVEALPLLCFAIRHGCCHVL